MIMKLTRTVMARHAPNRDEDRNERIVLSERDTKRVSELLENPPKPTAALRAAARGHRKQTGGRGHRTFRSFNVPL